MFYIWKEGVQTSRQRTETSRPQAFFKAQGSTRDLEHFMLWSWNLGVEHFSSSILIRRAPKVIRPRELRTVFCCIAVSLPMFWCQ